LRSAPFAAGGDNDDSPGPDGQPGPETMGAAGKRDSSPVVLVGYNPDGSPCLQSNPDCGHSCKGWVQGYGLGGNAKSDGNVLGLTYAMGGVMGGAERWVDDCHMFGFWGGYVGSNVESDGNQKISGGQFGGYMFSDNDTSYSIWLGGFEFDGYNTERQMAFDGIDRLASASYDGWQGFGYWERGVTYGSCNRVLQPFVALQYIYLRQNSFTESGANSVDLLSGGLDTRSFRSMLGARMQYALYSRNGKRFLPEIHALWLHEYLNSDTVVTANFAGPTTPGSFAVNGLDLGRDWVMLGASTTWELGGGWNMFVNYDCQTNSQQTLHVGSGGLGHMW
jgi:outer membrane autotransporter protein